MYAANSSMLGLVVKVARPRKICEVIQVSHGSCCQKFMNMEGQTSTSHAPLSIHIYIYTYTSKVAPLLRMCLWQSTSNK